MIQAIKTHLLDQEYERIKFYSIVAGALLVTAVLVVWTAMHCGGGVISDGAMRWSY